MRKFAHSLVVTAALFGAAGALAACNTMAGAGEDMQHGGADLQNSAVQHGATPPADQSAQPETPPAQQ
jgi:predicted small secreted protein